MRTLLTLLCLLLTPAIACAAAPQEQIATFSVVAYDPSTGEVGVAVQSKFFAVGSVVPWCEAGVGAVATQAFGQPEYGPQILDLMSRKVPAMIALSQLMSADDKAAQRQLGIVMDWNSFMDNRPLDDTVDIKWQWPQMGEVQNNSTQSVSYTGAECLDWAGGIARTAPDGVVYAVQGNILTGPEVVEAMARAMDDPTGIILPGAYANGQVGIALHTRDFAGRLLGALVAGQAAGGDSRGMQSAALKVSQAGAGYGGYNDVKYDLRVDDAADPFIELARLLNLARPIQLTFAGYRELEAGRTEAAISIFTDLVTLEPGNASHHYNLACGLARAGRADEAMAHLNTAIGLDPMLKDLAAKDTDLASLREREDFQKLVAGS